MERLQLHHGLLLKVDVAVHLRSREEDIIADFRRGGADAVDPSKTLHEACGVPRRVVVDHGVGAMQVHALRQHLRRDENGGIVAPQGPGFEVGVEVGADPITALIAVGGVDAQQGSFGRGSGESRVEVGGRLGRFGEEDDLAGRVFGRVEEFREHAEEHIELGILFPFGPFTGEGVPGLAQPAEDVQVTL